MGKPRASEWHALRAQEDQRAWGFAYVYGAGAQGCSDWQESRGDRPIKGGLHLGETPAHLLASSEIMGSPRKSFSLRVSPEEKYNFTSTCAPKAFISKHTGPALVSLNAPPFLGKDLKEGTGGRRESGRWAGGASSSSASTLLGEGGERRLRNY